MTIDDITDALVCIGIGIVGTMGFGLTIISMVKLAIWVLTP